MRTIGELKDIVAAGNILYSSTEVEFARELLASQMMLKAIVTAWDEDKHRYRYFSDSQACRGAGCYNCGGGPPDHPVHRTAEMVFLAAGIPIEGVFDPENGYHDPRIIKSEWSAKTAEKTAFRETVKAKRDEEGVKTWRKAK